MSSKITTVDVQVSGAGVQGTYGPEAGAGKHGGGHSSHVSVGFAPVKQGTRGTLPPAKGERGGSNSGGYSGGSYKAYGGGK